MEQDDILKTICEMSMALLISQCKEAEIIITNDERHKAQYRVNTVKIRVTKF